MNILAINVVEGHLRGTVMLSLRVHVPERVNSVCPLNLPHAMAFFGSNQL